MIDDLIAWLRAQLDDDERVAREATSGDWHWVDPGGPVKLALVAGAYDHGWHVVVPVRGEMVTRYDSDHIARWDPNRVLAEVDAKRRILDWIEGAQAAAGAPPGFDPQDAEALTHAVRLLALPYANRPGYRDEWRP
jgi:hypothetical protein